MVDLSPLSISFWEGVPGSVFAAPAHRLAAVAAKWCRSQLFLDHWGSIVRRVDSSGDLTRLEKSALRRILSSPATWEAFARGGPPTLAEMIRTALDRNRGEEVVVLTEALTASVISLQLWQLDQTAWRRYLLGRLEGASEVTRRALLEQLSGVSKIQAASMEQVEDQLEDLSRKFDALLDQVAVSRESDERSWLEELGPTTEDAWLTPYEILWPKNRVVPFVDVMGVLEQLKGWLHNDDGPIVHILSGAGGYGKTRTGVELCHSARSSGWIAGFLRWPAHSRPKLDHSDPVLVVIDYSRNKQLAVEELITQADALRRNTGQITKLLLIARPTASTSNIRLLLAGGHQNTSYRELIEAQVSNVTATWQLRSETEIDELYRLACRRLGTRGTERRHSPEGNPPSPLQVVLRAMLGDDISATSDTLSEVLEAVLHREQKLAWTFGSVTLSDPLIRQSAAVATFLGADSAAEAERHLATLVPALSTDQRSFVAWQLHDLYSGDRWWNPVEPDLVGEWLVGQCLSEDHILHALDFQSPATTARALEVLSRIASSDSPATLSSDLAGFLAAHLRELVAAARDYRP